MKALVESAKRSTDELTREEYDGFFRFKPSRDNDPGSDFYLGRLVPGISSADDATV